MRYPGLNDQVPQLWPVMHGVGPMYIIAGTTISPDRFRATPENPGISFTAVPPHNPGIPAWPNGDPETRLIHAARRLPPLSARALVVITTPEAINNALQHADLKTEFRFSPTAADPFHCELLNLPMQDPLQSIAANLVLNAIAETRLLRELLPGTQP